MYRWLTCHGRYALGEFGVDGCPTGYAPIDKDTNVQNGEAAGECRHAAEALKLAYDVTENDYLGRGVCNWCGSCMKGRGIAASVRLSKDHGAKAKWVCKRDSSQAG